MPTAVKLVEQLPTLMTRENRLGRNLKDLLPNSQPDRTVQVPAGKWEFYGDTSAFTEKGENVPSSVWLKDGDARVWAFSRGRGGKVDAQITEANDGSWWESISDGFPQDGIPTDVVQRRNGQDAVNYKLKSQYEATGRVQDWLQYAQP